MKAVDVVIPVYNDNPYLGETLKSIFIQQLPSGWAVNVYVVDDGSDEPVRIYDEDIEDISIVRLDENKGASVARNTGAMAGGGEAVLFLDADCSMKHEQVLALLLEQFENDFDVCFGQIDVEGNDFWAKYQRDVAKHRAQSFIAGDKASMSTAIFMVKRKLFEAVGGFDEAYHFGFEDRDLFFTLIKSGARIGLEDEALVLHNDSLSLWSVTKKSYGAGKNSSTRFIQKHPEEYKRMSYAKADVRYSNDCWTLLWFVTRPVLWVLIGMSDWGIKKEILPYALAKKVLKIVTGLAYLNGTAVAVKR